jgi:hypothetical protein
MCRKKTLLTPIADVPSALRAMPFATGTPIVTVEKIHVSTIKIAQVTLRSCLTQNSDRDGPTQSSTQQHFLYARGLRTAETSLFFQDWLRLLGPKLKCKADVLFSHMHMALHVGLPIVEVSSTVSC